MIQEVAVVISTTGSIEEPGVFHTSVVGVYFRTFPAVECLKGLKNDYLTDLNKEDYNLFESGDNYFHITNYKTQSYTEGKIVIDEVIV